MIASLANPSLKASGSEGPGPSFVVAVPIFPGSNCEHDTQYALVQVGAETVFVHHSDKALPAETAAIYIPGGFAHGDYLRAGAIARFSPITAAIGRAGADGMPVLGVCNGFQILCEMGLLPGALAPNTQGRFLCRDVHVKVENIATPFSRAMVLNQVLRIPINHRQGRYFADDATLRHLADNGQILFRYCDAAGMVDESDLVHNPNGSIMAIAGVTNENGNVVGMMPHPERAIESRLGSADGRPVLESLVGGSSPGAERE